MMFEFILGSVLLGVFALGACFKPKAPEMNVRSHAGGKVISVGKRRARPVDDDFPPKLDLRTEQEKMAQDFGFKIGGEPYRGTY